MLQGWNVQYPVSIADICNDSPIYMKRIYSTQRPVHTGWHSDEQNTYTETKTKDDVDIQTDISMVDYDLLCWAKRHGITKTKLEQNMIKIKNVEINNKDPKPINDVTVISDSDDEPEIVIDEKTKSERDEEILEIVQSHSENNKKWIQTTFYRYQKTRTEVISNNKQNNYLTLLTTITTEMMSTMSLTNRKRKLMQKSTNTVMVMFDPQANNCSLQQTQDPYYRDRVSTYCTFATGDMNNFRYPGYRRPILRAARLLLHPYANPRLLFYGGYNTQTILDTSPPQPPKKRGRPRGSKNKRGKYFL